MKPTWIWIVIVMLSGLVGCGGREASSSLSNQGGGASGSSAGSAGSVDTTTGPADSGSSITAVQGSDAQGGASEAGPATMVRCDGQTDQDFRAHVQDFLGHAIPNPSASWRPSPPDIDYTPSNTSGPISIRFDAASFGVRTVVKNGCIAEMLADLPSVTVDVLGKTFFVGTVASPAPFAGAGPASLYFTGRIHASAMTGNTFHVLKVADASDVEIVLDFAALGGLDLWGALSLVTSSGKEVQVADWQFLKPPTAGFPPTHSYE